MTIKSSDKQIFQYPVYRNWGVSILSANEGAVFGGILTLILLWSCIYAPTVRPGQTWIQRGLVVICLCLTLLLLYVDKILNGYIEVTKTCIKHVYKSGAFLSLDWDDIEIIPLKNNSWLSTGIKLVSKSGKKPITVEGRIRDYKELCRIIGERVSN